MTRDLAGRVLVALLWRGAGEGGEKLIFLARLIVLARLLTPEDFGLIAIGMIVIAVSVNLTNFGLVPALIQQPASDKRHLDTAWTIGMVRGAVVTLFLVVTAPWLAAAFQEPRATDIIRALSLSVLIQAAASIEIARLNRELRFRGLTAIRLSSALANTAVAIGLASAYGAWAIVWGAVAGALASVLCSYVVAPYRPGFRFSSDATASLVRYGRWIYLISVLSVASDGVLRWLIATQLGIAELGLFFMAVRLAFLPANLANSLVNEVAFPVYAELQTDPERGVAAFRTALIALSALVVPTCLVFLELVPDLVTHVLGDHWAGAAGVMQLLILTSIAALLSDCISPVLKGVGRPAGVAAMDALQLLLTVVLAVPLTHAFGLVGAGAAWLGAAAGSQALAVGYIRGVFEKPFADLLLPALGILAISGVAVGAAAVVRFALPGVSGVAGGILAAIAAAAAVTPFLDRQLGLGILQTLSEPFPLSRRSTGGRSP